MNKRIISFALVIVLVFLVGCSESSNKFTFSYSIEQDKIIKGERIGISVTLINDSNKKYTYSGSESEFRATVKLFCNDGEMEYIIPIEPIPSTDDVGKHIIEPHKGKTSTFYFAIPIDAPSGNYNLRVAYKESNTTYTNIFTLTD